MKCVYSKMVQKISQNSSGKARDCNKEQIFSKEVREFVHESRKCQTVYINHEGFHDRTVKFDDLTKLNDLVFLTLSDGKERTSLSPYEFAEAHKLTKLLVKKIHNSCMKFKCNSIHFQIVWIYYFDYLEKEMKAMPVFKVYRNDLDLQPVYIDISAIEFHSWDHFIMFGQFPASFICVPRRGEYTFRNIDGEELLDLEYICKNSQLQNKFYRSTRPFSQTVIQRHWTNVTSFVTHLRKYVLKRKRFFYEAIKIASNGAVFLYPEAWWFPLLINIAGIILRLLELKYEGNDSQKALESTAADCSLMLLNDNGEKPSDWKMFLNRLYDVVDRSLRDRSWIDVWVCIKNPRENYQEILKYVPATIEFLKPFILTVPGENGVILNVFLEFLSVLICRATENNKIQGQGSKESEKNSSEKFFSESCLRLSEGKEVTKSTVDLIGLEESGIDLVGFKICLLTEYTRAKCKSFLQSLLKSNYTLQEGTPCQAVRLDGNLIGFVIPFSFNSQKLAIIVLHLNKLPEVNNIKLN